MTKSAVVLTDLGFAYDEPRWVFRGYTAAFREKNIVALLGPNGRGKTTLLKMIVGTLKPKQGTIAVSGDVAFVPQAFDTTFGFTALEMVLMGRARQIGLLSQPSRGDIERSCQALEHFGLADLAHRPFHEMSGGQRQLVIFARALVSDARIIVLDEPTSSLDFKNQSVVLEWMSRLSRLSREDGLTVIFSTHHAGHALAIADDALLMLGTTEYAFGLAGDVLTEQRLSKLYDMPIKRVRVEHDGAQFDTISPVILSRRR
jgi:iron complex transport system ATP-binding protein